MKTAASRKSSIRKMSSPPPSCACYSPEAVSPCVFVDNMYKPMAYYGFGDIQYVNQSAVGTNLDSNIRPPSWRVGVWNIFGENRILALKQCISEDDAIQWESPLGWDIADALTKAIEKLVWLRATT